VITSIKSDKNIEEKANQRASIKGVGILTVAVLLAETNGFVLFENCRQLVSYAGYNVVENQSGKRSGKTKISKKGNSHIRRALFMPAFSVITYEIKPFSDLFNRTFENHKIKMKSYVAVQKKLLVIMYSLWKKEVSFTDNFIETNTKEWKQESTSLVELE
jgi:transposase